MAVLLFFVPVSFGLIWKQVGFGWLVFVFSRLYTCTYHMDLYVWLKKRALYMLVLVGCWPVNSGYQPYRQRAVRAIVAVSPTHPRTAHT